MASGWHHTAEHKARMSAQQKGRPGRPQSAESRDKIKAARARQQITAETRAKMSAAMKGRPGKSPSEETRAKLAAAQTGKKATPETRAKMSAAHTGKPKSAAHVAASKAAINTPEVRAKRRAKILQWWSTLDATARAKHMRPFLKASQKNPSGIEVATWSLLDALGIEYETQFPIGPYVADVFVRSRNLVIECDGEYWHQHSVARDARRDAYMIARGFKVLRLPEQAIRSGASREILSRALAV
jgi:very-short-patch-repair endonuclease